MLLLQAALIVRPAPADDLTALYFDGEVNRQQGHGAAVCREQLGQKAEARRDYEEYARRFPEDDRAKEATAAIKRLAGS